jgi:hypothetical protein
VQARELAAHGDAQLGVEVRQRLVHEVRGGLAHHGASHRDALALAAGELAGLALEEIVEAEDLRDLVHAPGDLLLGRLAHLEAEGEVLPHAHVGVERVVLEHHRDVAGAGRGVGDVLAADLDHALADLLEAGDHAQQRRLAAARRADEDHELALADLQVDVLDRAEPVPVDLGDVLQADAALGLRGGDLVPVLVLAHRGSTTSRRSWVKSRMAKRTPSRPDPDRRSPPYGM